MRTFRFSDKNNIINYFFYLPTPVKSVKVKITERFMSFFVLVKSGWLLKKRG